MKVGIIAEGKADQAVIANILKALINIDRSDLHFIQPEHYLDETDLSNSKNSFSNWELVFKECSEKEKIKDFFDSPIESERFLVIHVDTAEANLKNYDITKPEKKNNENYVQELRDLVLNKITGLLGSHAYDIAYAICVEETDAWVLPIYSNYLSNIQETGTINSPKEKLKEIIENDLKPQKLKELNDKNTYEKYRYISDKMRKNKNLKTYRKMNKSLDVFCLEVESIIG